ncbi:MAG: glycosyltransferase family 2 protein [Treponema sp.]|nr:glycosyltransferase family 2 protein [Candidatus Treponema merdequi]
MKKVFLSVVIPLYNSEKTLNESIGSVAAEIGKLYSDEKNVKQFSLENTVSEIILCDDGSFDKTSILCDQLAEKINSEKKEIEVKVMHLKNGGVASARNIGMKYSRGEVIAFNDSDDRWLCGTLVKRLTLLKNENAELITANHEIESQRVKKLLPTSFPNLYIVKTENELFKNYYTVQNSIISRKIIDDGIFFKDGMRYAEEMYFFFQVLQKYKCLFLNEKMSESVLHKERFGQSGLSGNLKAMEKGELTSLSLTYKELKMPFAKYVTACVYSILKYFRRVLICSIRK